MNIQELRLQRQERAEIEEEIKQVHARGDLQLAAEKGLRLYGGEISAWLIRRCECAHMASEIYSDFCLYFWQWFEAFNWNSSIRTWMYSIARKVCYSNLPRNHLPLSQVPENVSALIVEKLERISTYKYPGVEEAYKNLSDRVLSQEEKDLLIWRIDRQMSWQDIARILADEPFSNNEELERRANALRVRFNRIKNKLRNAAQEEGYVR